MFSCLLSLTLESTHILLYNSLNVQLFPEAVFSCLLRLTMKSSHIRAFVIYLMMFSCLLRLPW